MYGTVGTRRAQGLKECGPHKRSLDSRSEGTSMLFFYAMALLFLAMMIWSVYQHIIFMKKMRAKRNYKGATLNITENIIPERIIEPSSWVLLISLDIGVSLLGILTIFLLLTGPKSDGILFNPKDALTFWTVLFLCFPAASVSGYLFGAPIARAIQSYFSKVRHWAFSDEGLLYAGKIFAWEHFRGYKVSSDRRYIYLLSKYYPTAIAIAFAPTSKEDFDLVVGQIEKHLPNCAFTSDDQEVGIFRNVYFQAVLLSVILLLIGLTSLLLPSEIGIILNSLLMYLHLIISLRIVDRIMPAHKFPDAEIE